MTNSMRTYIYLQGFVFQALGDNHQYTIKVDRDDVADCYDDAVAKITFSDVEYSKEVRGNNDVEQYEIMKIMLYSFDSKFRESRLIVSIDKLKKIVLFRFAPPISNQHTPISSISLQSDAGDFNLGNIISPIYIEFDNYSLTKMGNRFNQIPKFLGCAAQISISQSQTDQHINGKKWLGWSVKIGIALIVLGFVALGISKYSSSKVLTQKP